MASSSGLVSFGVGVMSAGFSVVVSLALVWPLLTFFGQLHAMLLRFRTTLMPTIRRLSLGLPCFLYLDPFT